MKLFHGTNQRLKVLVKGTWVTSVFDVAQEFAQHKVDENGGEAVIFEIDVSEDIIDWDIISLLAGVEDERGTLLQEVDINDEPSD